MSFSRKRCGTSMGNEGKKSDESSISSMENASKNIAQSLTSIVMASRDEVNRVKFLDLVGVQSESELVAALSKCIFACLLDPKSAKQRKGDQVPSGQSQVPAPAAGDEKDNTAPASEMDINMDDCYDNNYPPAIIGSIVNNVMQRRFSQD